MARYLAAWLPMILIAAANGALREAWLVPRLGEHAARQVLQRAGQGQQPGDVADDLLRRTFAAAHSPGRAVAGLRQKPAVGIGFDGSR